MIRLLLSLILLFLTLGSLWAVPPLLNYAGQVSVDGQRFDGEAKLKFALVNPAGTVTYWSQDGTSENGSEPTGHVSAQVRGGLYSILIGNTAISGMRELNASVFQEHDDVHLRVWFSDGINGFERIAPDRPFAAVPYALSAGSADIAPGSISLNMLGTDVQNSLSGTIPRERLASDVLSDINRTITKSMLSQEVLDELNASGGVAGSMPGSLIAVPANQSAPSGYELYQRGEPKELVWEEKAPVSVARYAYDTEVINGKIYFPGGRNSSITYNILECYNPMLDSWETLSSMSVPRYGAACAVLNNKMYVIGGQDLSSVEIYDPSSDTWTAGISLPSEVNHGSAIAVDGKIFLIGGKNSSDSYINQTLCFDPVSNQWTEKEPMTIARHGHKLVYFKSKIWVIGGGNGTNLANIDSYDPVSDSWTAEASMNTARSWPSAWVANDLIYACGGSTSGGQLGTCEFYDPTSQKWSITSELPQPKYAADAVVLENQVYIFAGSTSSNVFSNKVFAADLNASMEGVHDLYVKTGDASTGTPTVQAEVADGSITANQLSEQILKYLKPEITQQPNATTIFADTNHTISVTAEGKYLTYQWKKNGVNLAGETNATLTITDANATLHDGNYSVVVSNDFGSVESGVAELLIPTWLFNGLIAWYPLDQNASDMSGLGNHGTLKNTPQFVTQDGKSFVTFEATNDNDDTGDHILIPFSSFSPFTQITISGWLNFINSSHSGDHSAAIISFGDHTAGLIGVFAVNTGTNSGFGFAINRTTLTLRGVQNTWVHFVITGDQETCAGYLNAENVGTGSGLGSYSGGNAAIGRDWWNNGLSTGTRLNGSLDEIRIYNRAMSATEVQALYQLGQ
jgi:hypothetical protein